MVVYCGVRGDGILGRVGADVSECLVQGVCGNCASCSKLGSALGVLQVIDVQTGQVFDFCPRNGLPLGPELLGRLLVRIQVFDVDRHGAHGVKEVLCRRDVPLRLGVPACGGAQRLGSVARNSRGWCRDAGEDLPSTVGSLQR
jgi:hypothetical protein